MKQPMPEIAFEQQRLLSDYCRTGDEPELQGVTSGRVEHYRRLVYNVVEDSIATAYPVTKSFLDGEEWDGIVHDFFSHHKCSSAQVWKMPHEFYGYITDIEHPLLTAYPFLADLLWFEWLEVELFLMEDIETAPYRNSGDLLTDSLVLNPESTVISFSYPVHKTPPADIHDTDKGQYYVLMFRQPDTGSVQFFEMSLFFAWLLEQLEEKGNTVSELLEQATELFGVSKEDATRHTITFLHSLQEKGYLLGFK